MSPTILILAAIVTLGMVSAALYFHFLGNHIWLGTIITFIGVVLIMSGFWSQIRSVFGTSKEGLTNMSQLAPGDYPQIEETLPLEPWYPANTPFHLSAMTYESENKEKRIFPATSTNLNLIKYWPNPSNGSCIPPELCGAFYKDIKPDVDVEPQAPAWTSSKRVNFYETTDVETQGDQA